MGICHACAAFTGSLPSLEEIRRQVEKSTGLAVRLEASDLDNGRLFFACLPKQSVEVQRRTPERIQEASATLECMGLQGFFPGLPDSRLGVRLRFWVGQEPTLYYHACQALGALGGELAWPREEGIPQERLQQLTEEELLAQARKMHKEMNRIALLWIVLLPILVPVWLLWAFWKLILNDPLERHRNLIRALRSGQV